MSQAFPALTAAQHLGLNQEKQSWLCWQINQAVMTFGQWVDARRHETIEVADDRPRRDKPTRLKPKYETLDEALGVVEEQFEETPEVVEEALALLAGKVNINDWM